MEAVSSTLKSLKEKSFMLSIWQVAWWASQQSGHCGYKKHHCPCQGPNVDHPNCCQSLYWWSMPKRYCIKNSVFVDNCFMQISTELILTREFQYVTSLTAHFGAVTMTNINNKMSALTYEHHTLHQWPAALCQKQQSLHLQVSWKKKKLSFD